MPAHVQQTLAAAGVQYLPYDGLLDFLKSHNFKGKVWVDGRTANQAVYRYRTFSFDYTIFLHLGNEHILSTLTYFTRALKVYFQPLLLIPLVQL